MITKSYELNKINLNQSPFILLYGKNEGFKNQAITQILKNKDSISKYEEKEILENSDDFLESIFSMSLFESEKILVIKRTTDKILNILTEIIRKDVKDIILILSADILDKKSKLRSFFEKDKKCVCIPFYPDNEQTLSKLAYNFLREKNISLSSSDINLVVSKSNGDRKILLSELDKLEYYSKNGKKITTEHIMKLTNLIENFSISELVDNCLANNTRKTKNILIENNFGNEDCVLIIRTFLNKLKRILKLCAEFQENKDINLTIASAKPAIFWKDKDITKQQILRWSPNEIKETIYKLNNIELMVKKNFGKSINLITDFILSQISSKISN
jgi:DNA polymerase-3 subunit delta